MLAVRMKRTIVTLCSGSSGSHVLAADLGRREDFELRLLTRNPEAWSERIECEEHRIASDTLPFVSSPRVESYAGTLAGIYGWESAAEACEGADIIVLACPVHCHRPLLERVLPALDSRRPTILGSLFAQGGFDWIYRELCEELDIPADRHTLFGLKRYPFLCRKERYGHSVSLFGRFPRIVAGFAGNPALVDEARELLARMFEKPVTVLPAFVSCTLSLSNQVLHPGIGAAILRDYVPGLTRFSGPVPFYGSCTPAAVDSMLRMAHEIMSVGEALERSMGLSLTEQFGADPVFRTYVHWRRLVGRRLEGRHGYELLRNHVCDLLIRGNRRLEPAGFPLVPADDGSGFVPNFGSRFWLDDIPHGLCVVYGIGAILGVAMPEVRKMILLHQGWMKRDYLRAMPDDPHDPFGEERDRTNAPQRYGVRDRAALERLIVPS
jgi:opine dehydrogenase